MKISDKFFIENAKSKSITDHEDGNVPFVSNGTDNDGVIGFVETYLKKKKVFKEKAICISSFCEVSVHNPPFFTKRKWWKWINCFSSQKRNE